MSTWTPAAPRRTVTVRVRSLLIAAAVILAAAAAVLGARWLDGFTPLAAGSSGGGGPHVTVADPVDGSDGVPVYRFAYREHGTAYWVVSVRNTSRFDIRVTGLDVPGGRDDSLFRFAGLRLTSGPNVIGWQGARPFHPTTVPAGSELPLVVVLRIGNCRWNSYGASATADSVTLRYTLFGVLHRSESVKVGSAVSVAAPRASACPER